MLTAPITTETWATATLFAGGAGPRSRGHRAIAQLAGIDLTSALYFAIRTQDEASNTSALSNVPRVMWRDPLLHSGCAR